MDIKPAALQMHIPLHIEHKQEGSYFTIPFRMPANTESLTLSYQYERHHESTAPVEHGTFTSRKTINIIDLGLIAPDVTQVGASGSDKLSITISETQATPGYQPYPLVAGEWQIIVGAYKVAEAGVDVRYELNFTSKFLRLYKGDLHVHTHGSDGVLPVGELARHAQCNGLDYLGITDHNQMVSTDTLRQYPGITLMPGIEWTHYQGHANFLGVDQPYNELYITNSFEEVKQHFESARSRGAFISINHPCDPMAPFKFDIDALPYDCLEVWNGPMRGSNLQAIGLWQNLLMTGKKVPICGGSDYHRDSLLLFPGGPTTCIYAMSASQTDLLAALKHGHAFVTYSVNGPMLEMTAGEALLGDSVDFARVKQLEFKVTGLVAGDVIQVTTNRGNTHILKAETDGAMQGAYTLEAPGFAWLQVLRSFLPGLPLLPALISNPIYFNG
jgi:hypothetical protein